MNKHKYLFQFIALCCLVLTLSSGCKKEIENWIDVKAPTVTDTVSKLAGNRIIDYKVANAGPIGIYSSIHNEDKTITVFLPEFYALSYLETNISLPEGTTISPAQDELVPVFSESPFVYTVTDRKGVKAEYEVKIVIQQPNFWVNELSTATTKKTYGAGSVITIAGGNLLPNYGVTKIYLVDAADNKVYQAFVPFTNGVETSIAMNWYFDRTDILTNTAVQANTDYWVIVESYALKVKMQYPIRISK